MKHLISTLVVFTVFAVNALFAELAMRIEYINSEEYQATISSIARWEIDAKNVLNLYEKYGVKYHFQSCVLF